MRGWVTRSVTLPEGDPLHLRPMGTHDGLLRGFRRWGACAYTYGEHPLHILAVAVQRVTDRPPLLGSLNYLLGWMMAGLRRMPRAEPELREYVARRHPPARAAAARAGSPAAGHTPASGEGGLDMKIAVIVPFLDEEEHLGELLDSISRQVRVPDRLLLVDDGSSDRGPQLASAFAKRHAYATLLRLPPAPAQRDRLVGAHEWRAFELGLARLGEDYDVVGKLDADLRLTRDFLAEIERQLELDPSLGMAGAYLSSAIADGVFIRHRCPPEHVEGATRFYRWRCLQEVQPIPAILGWDTIDEVRARMRGWRTASFPMPSGDPVHLRRTGSHDGVLRGYRRAGFAAFGYGADPLHVLLAGVNRMRDPPVLLCGLSYLAGWSLAALRRSPRAEPDVRRFVRRENRRRIRALTTLRSRA